TFLIGLNIANPDAFIARLNIEKFKTTHDKNLLAYTDKLSEDAIDEIIAAYSLRGPTYRYANSKLKARIDSIKGAPWQSYNISRARALKALDRLEVGIDDTRK
ncbi:MAG TPA: hypothetical protein VE439_00790, partial [Anaerolineae bacterium]|nr:hypothetical protein [Anaerolineae bacterium]